MAGFNSGATKRQKMIEAIELEFGEPLRDIVVVMRLQGCSWATIAGSLEISPQTMLDWRKAYGFARPDRSFVVRESNDDEPYKDNLAKGFGYRNFVSLYADLRLSKKWLVRDIAEYLGVHPSTVNDWATESMKEYMYIPTPARVESRSANLEKARAAKMAKHGTLWTHDL